MYIIYLEGKKKAPEGAFLLFLVTRYNYLVAALRLLMRNFRLRLVYLLDLRSSPTGNSTSSISPVDPIHPHQLYTQ